MDSPQKCLDDIYRLCNEGDKVSDQYPMLSRMFMFIEEAFHDHRLDDIDYMLEHIDFDRVNKQALISLSRGSFRGKLHTPHWRSHVDKTYLWLNDQKEEDADHVMRGLMGGSKVVDPRYRYKAFLKDHISTVDFFSPPNAISVWLVIDHYDKKDNIMEGWFNDE